MPKYSTSIKVAPLTEAYKKNLYKREKRIDMAITLLALVVAVAGAFALYYCR